MIKINLLDTLAILIFWGRNREAISVADAAIIAVTARLASKSEREGMGTL